MRIDMRSLAQTESLAKQISSQIKPGDVLFFEGPVGIGKSTLIKYILAEFGLDYVGSPTFGLMNIYKNSSDIVFRHIDLYNNPRNVIREIGDVDREILLIEWAELSDDVAKWFPHAMKIRIDENRVVEILS